MVGAGRLGPLTRGEWRVVDRPHWRGGETAVEAWLRLDWASGDRHSGECRYGRGLRRGAGIGRGKPRCYEEFDEFWLATDETRMKRIARMKVVERCANQPAELNDSQAKARVPGRRAAWAWEAGSPTSRRSTTEVSNPIIACL
jgi:hypothetical protein